MMGDSSFEFYFWERLFCENHYFLQFSEYTCFYFDLRWIRNWLSYETKIKNNGLKYFIILIVKITYGK